MESWISAPEADKKMNDKDKTPMERFEDLGRKIFQAPKAEPEELEEETNGELERDPQDEPIVEE